MTCGSMWYHVIILKYCDYGEKMNVDCRWFSDFWQRDPFISIFLPFFNDEEDDDASWWRLLFLLYYYHDKLHHYDKHHHSYCITIMMMMVHDKLMMMMVMVMMILITLLLWTIIIKTWYLILLSYEITMIFIMMMVICFVMINISAIWLVMIGDDSWTRPIQRRPLLPSPCPTQRRAKVRLVRRIFSDSESDGVSEFHHDLYIKFIYIYMVYIWFIYGIYIYSNIYIYIWLIWLIWCLTIWCMSTNACEQWLLNPCWLMISSGIIQTTLYILGITIIQERGIPFLTNQD